LESYRKSAKYQEKFRPVVGTSQPDLMYYLLGVIVKLGYGCSLYLFLFSL